MPESHTDTGGLELDGNEFYLVQFSGQEDVVCLDEDAAITMFGSEADNVSANKEDVSILHVSYGGEDWEIRELPWKRVALSLLSDHE